MKKNYLFLIFLFILNPPLIFFLNNIDYYNFSYFKIIFLFSLILFSLAIFSIYVLKKFISKKHLENFFLFLSILWFLQFYFIDIVDLLNIKHNFFKYIIIIIIILISLTLGFIKNNKLYKFLINFNLIILLLIFVNNYSFHKNIDNNEQVSQKFYHELKNYDKKLVEKNNIYFFIMDEMSSRNFLLSQGLDIKQYINFFNTSGFQYLADSLSSYNGSQYSMGSIFNMEYYKENIPIKEIKFFPYNLYSKFGKPNLLKTLDFLDYNFWFLDNQYMKCKENPHIKCIGKNNIAMRILKDESIQVFFQKSLLRSIINKVLYLMNVQNYDDTEIDKMIRFIELNENVIAKKNNFFFIHQIGPHHPHRDPNCKLLNIHERYRVNLQYYLNSTLCALNNISNMIKKIELYDNDATIVFQGDHGYSLYGDDNKIESFQIFNMVKFSTNCSKKLNPSIGNVETINEVLHCFRKEKSLTNNIGNYIVKNKDSKGTVFKKVKLK